MNLLNIMAITRYEMKLLMRTARFWILCSLGFLFAGFITANLIINFVLLSGMHSMGGLMNPSNLGYYTASNFNFIIMIVLVFFVFNFSSKDRSSKVNDVLLSKSLSSIDIIFGKYFGVVIPVILVNLFTIILCYSAGLIVLDAPVSLISFLDYFLLINIPTILYFTAFCFFLVQLTRKPFAAILISLVYIFVMLINSKYFYNLLDFGAYISQYYFSDLVGLVNIGDFVIKRIFYILLSILLLSLTVFLYPRLRQREKAYLILKGLIVIIVLFSMAVIAYFPYKAEKREEFRRDALKAEKKYADYSAPHLKHYSMDVDLTGRNAELVISADMKIVNDTENNVKNLVFSLNPGLDVKICYLRNEKKNEEVKYIKDYSIININLPESLAPNDSVNIVIQYEGSLDERAFFLEFDESKPKIIYQKLMQETTGEVYYISDEDYSLLFPETVWYPTLGPDNGYKYPDKKRVSFSTSDLRIKVHEGQTVLTQGELVSSEEKEGYKIYRWVSDVPVPKISINSGVYNTATMIRDDIKYSLYYAPVHNMNISLFSDFSDTLKSVISEKMNDFNKKTGVSYPYKNISLIEIPLQVAEYSKGKHIKNLLSQPGIAMMKEGGFLTAQFKRQINKRIERMKNRGEYTTGINYKIDVFRSFISSLGNYDSRIDHKFVPNYWEFRLESTGQLNHLITQNMNNVVAEWISGVGITETRKMERAIFGISFRLKEDFSDPNLYGIRNLFISADSLYRLMKERPLSAFLPEGDAELYRAVLRLKGEPMIKALRSMIGDEGFKKMFKNIVLKYANKYLTMDDLKNEAEKIYEKKLDDFFDWWLRDTEIPGFILKSSDVYKIESEVPSYQIILRLKNGEDSKGWAKIIIKMQGDKIEKFLSFEGYEEKEIKYVLRNKPEEVEIEPFFSQNRGSFSEKVRISEDRNLKKGEESIKTVSFDKEQMTDEIIVDNLDEGFWVEDLSEGGFFRPKPKESKKKDFRVISGYYGPTSDWFLRARGHFYGKYYHTAITKGRGSGSQVIVWQAEISEPGNYIVYFYFFPEYGRLRLGKYYKMTVHHDDGKDEINFDIKNSIIDGWNKLGEYHFSKGRYRVVLSDESDARMIIADAVKWVKR